MKKQFLEWMQEMKWEQHSLGNREHCLTLDLGDRSIISHGKIVSVGSGATFYHGAGVTFPIFLELAKHLQPNLDYSFVIVSRLHRPVFYKTERTSKKFFRECNQKLVAWAGSMSLEDVVKEKCRLELDDGVKIYHRDFVTHLSALILDQSTDILRCHLKALDEGISPHFNVNLSNAKELLGKAVHMSLNPEWSVSSQQTNSKIDQSLKSQSTKNDAQSRISSLLGFFKPK